MQRTGLKGLTISGEGGRSVKRAAYIWFLNLKRYLTKVEYVRLDTMVEY